MPTEMTVCFLRADINGKRGLEIGKRSMRPQVVSPSPRSQLVRCKQEATTIDFAEWLTLALPMTLRWF